MTVRIGQAVGAGNFGEVGLLMKWAAVGGFACGAAGATLRWVIPVPMMYGAVCSHCLCVCLWCCSTVVTYIYPIFNFFVPLRQGVSLPTDCPLIPAQPAELQAIARPYWILSAWAWPATFSKPGSCRRCASSSCMYNVTDFSCCCIIAWSHSHARHHWCLRWQWRDTELGHCECTAVCLSAGRILSAH